jgi:hypothetical protein
MAEMAADAATAALLLAAAALRMSVIASLCCCTARAYSCASLNPESCGSNSESSMVE